MTTNPTTATGVAQTAPWHAQVCSSSNLLGHENATGVALPAGITQAMNLRQGSHRSLCGMSKFVPIRFAWATKIRQKSHRSCGGGLVVGFVVVFRIAFGSVFGKEEMLYGRSPQFVNIDVTDSD